MKCSPSCSSTTNISWSSTSTTTPSPGAAIAAFLDLRKDESLEGTDTHLVMSKNQKHVLYHRFDVAPGDNDYVDVRLVKSEWKVKVPEGDSLVTALRS